MIFSSGVFIFIFLPIALLGYELYSRMGRAPALMWLSVASMFFYGYWNPRYLALLLGSIAMNYAFSYALVEGRKEVSRSRWLSAAITCNILLLVYFKYLFPVLNFFHIHGAVRHGFPDVILPLGISFFTFTQIAYLIDLRQGIARHQGIIPYTVFVTFFPHLIAGPIIHPREMMPQFDAENIRGVRAADLSLGLTWFALGLAKKVLIADRISPYADRLFGHPAAAGTSSAWIGSLAYAMQLYFDFSGYSDMALGLARMFSIRFPFNFNSPFKAHGVIEFWTRWHMTLSRYLNEYLYTPILRWRKARRTARGLKSNMRAAASPGGYLDMVVIPSIFTMGIAGVWHGAGLQFIVFGLLHGVYLSINHAWRFLTPVESRWHNVVPAPFFVVLNFLAVLVGLIFFRAASVSDALHVLAGMTGLHAGSIAPALFFALPVRIVLVALALCFFIVWALPNTQELLEQLPANTERSPSLPMTRIWSMDAVPAELRIIGGAVLVYFVLFLGEQPKTFLYFQF